MDNSQDPMAGMTEQKTSAVKWGKVGDWIKGTLVDNSREIENTLNDKHEMQRIYEIKVTRGGSFHGINEDKTVQENPTVLELGSFWSVFGKAAIQNQMRNAKIGQIVGMRFESEKPPTKKGLNATKIIKVYLGEMDPDYQGEQAGDAALPL